MVFHNNPKLGNEAGVGQIKRYSHQPLTIEHYGIHAQIKENGKVVISSGVVTNSDGTEEFDEIEIPASLVFKLANLLKDTRKVEYVNVVVSENKLEKE
jgi:DNA/RNA endonuclease G (NUC1)